MKKNQPRELLKDNLKAVWINATADDLVRGLLFDLIFHNRHRGNAGSVNTQIAVGYQVSMIHSASFLLRPRKSIVAENSTE